MAASSIRFEWQEAGPCMVEGPRPGLILSDPAPSRRSMQRRLTAPTPPIRATRCQCNRSVYTKSFQPGHMIFSARKKKLFIAFLILTGLAFIGIGVTHRDLRHDGIP